MSSSPARAAGAAAEAAAKLDGVAKVLLADAPPTPLARRAARRAHRRRWPAATTRSSRRPTTIGKNVLPRVAALLDVMQVSDVIDVVSPDTFERPIYAGNAIQTVQLDRRQEGRHRPHRLLRRPPARAARPPVEPVDGRAAIAGLSRFGARRSPSPSGPSSPRRKIVVSGGRALGSKENFKEVIEPLADKLGAAVGASRARRSTPATRRTTGRSARPARSSRPTSTSPSASPARSSTSPA